ncbi:MAG: transposase, partial [Chloroflexi bacterium]|nr:transposase [Chloroflexota bacterium]
MLDELDLSGITDPEARRVISVLLNAVETLMAETQALRAENQRLRDENNRLKGEQGAPAIRPSKRAGADHASERERCAERPTRAPTHTDKRSLIRIDRTEEREVDPALRPRDAERKGYAEFVVQDVALRTDTVLFRCARWYAASTGRSYQAPLPDAYRDQGHYGPGLKALALQLYYQGQMSEPKILEVLRSVGIVISAAQLSTLLIEQPVFAAEYEDIARAGLASAPSQHLDETSTRVDGVEEHCHILCGPLYTSYRTTARKDRQAVLDVLRLGAPRAYQLNRYAWAFLAGHELPAAVVTALGQLPHGVDLDADSFGALLDAHVPRLGPQQRAHILDAAAIGAYRVQRDVPVVEILVCDDAPQFKGVTAGLALCWVHAGRHFKKLAPIFAHHRALVDTFLTDLWAYYHDLQAYRAAPTARERARLDAAFDTLFARRTGYWHLDERIAKTAAKKEALLCALDHPEVPLHNNPAELGARHRVRKRDVSFGPRSRAGIAAWDIFGTITQTAAKLGVNIAPYLHDRLSGANRMPS